MDTTKSQVDAVQPADARDGFMRSREAFLRDLPALLANPKYDRWSVVYRDNERIALVKTLTEATRICRERGFSNDECYIGCIHPHSNEEIEDIDFGLAEFEEEIDDVQDAQPES